MGRLTAVSSGRSRASGQAFGRSLARSLCVAGWAEIHLEAGLAPGGSTRAQPSEAGRAWAGMRDWGHKLGGASGLPRALFFPRRPGGFPCFAGADLGPGPSPLFAV